MARHTVIGLAGNFNRPSRTRALVETAVAAAAHRFGCAGEVYDLIDVGPSLGSARSYGQLDGQGRRVVDTLVAADALIVGSPTYKGSYTGLFKHLIDLLDPLSLRGKPVLLTATGGGDRHALMVEHQLRPLFGFFMAHALPTAVFASDRDFLDGRLRAGPCQERLDAAVGELSVFFGRGPAVVAAE